MEFRNDKKSHYIALSLTIFLHIILIFWLVFKKSQPVIIQQTIRVEMVAPSSHKQIKKQNNQKTKEDFIKAHKAKNINLGITKKIPQRQEKQDYKNSSEVNSSGEVDKNATTRNSANSQPIFNAAYLNNPTPAYPQYAKAKGYEGKVLLEVTVGKNGEAKDIKIRHSSGYDSLDNAAKNAVAKWRFIPAYIGSEPVEAKVFVPIEFKLN